MIAPLTRSGDDERMTAERRADAAGWVLMASAIGAGAIGSAVLGAVATPSEDGPWVLSGAPAWIVLLPLAVLATLAIALWSLARGDRRLATWTFATATLAMVYSITGAGAGWLLLQGYSDSWMFAACVWFAGSGWTTVLAMLQGTAFVAAQSVLDRRFARPALFGTVAAGCAVTLISAFFPGSLALDDFPDMPALLPREVAGSIEADLAIALTIYVWMASLLIAPIVLWIGAGRATGVRRHVLVRVAAGALLPGLVVMMCGVLAVLVGRDSTGAEVNGLATGFTTALPLTAWWLSATVRDAVGPGPRVRTGVAGVVHVLLWVFYLLAVAQLAGPIASAWGDSPAVGAVTATALLALTLVPWSWLVRWCAAKVDARAALAASIAARGDRPAGERAETALREALADPDARVLLRRPHHWIDVNGELVAPPSDESGLDAASVVFVPGRDAPVAAIVHHARFADLRGVAAAVQPLIERAALEADLREQSERVAAERRRADDATDEARRRIERDLHDGVQGRLVSLGLGLSLARDDLPDPLSRGLIDETVAQLHDAVAELRELSTGTLSVRLAETGLAAAVGDLVQRMPVPVHVDIAPLRVADDLEAVVYFVIAEALTNAVKHAAPSRVAVRVAAGDELVVSVADDGAGGADLRAGSGLRGLQERVRAAGGRLVVSDGIPSGTLVEAVLPCGS